MRIGNEAPAFRTPAFSEAQGFTYLSSHSLIGQIVILTFVPQFGLAEVWRLNSHAEELLQRADRILVVVPEPQFLTCCWLGQLTPLPLVLLTDPCGRMRRSYGVTLDPPGTRCLSFAFDVRARLRFHLVHDFDDRGLNALQEMLALPQLPVAL